MKGVEKMTATKGLAIRGLALHFAGSKGENHTLCVVEVVVYVLGFKQEQSE